MRAVHSRVLSVITGHLADAAVGHLIVKLRNLFTGVAVENLDAVDAYLLDQFWSHEQEQDDNLLHGAVVSGARR